MIRLSSCLRQLNPFHSSHPSIAPPGCRRQPVACTTESIQQTQPLFICKSSYQVQTSNLLLKQRSAFPFIRLSSSKYIRAVSRMRDLVNIASLGTSSALAANASPKRPQKAVNHERFTEQPIVGSTDEVYQEAVRKLNTLQSNAKTLDEIRKNRDMGAYKNIPDVIDYAARVGISLERLDELSCVHVAGTKGKGSVCAFTESILRESGFKTGFYSSPHLVEVRERIRINGQPLPKEDFAKHFFTVYNRLHATKEGYDGKMPAYFRFLTLMAFHTFLEEKVDVAIMEVGIGGEYDCTNIIRKPVVVGITSLGIDHIGVLGNTIDKIAWHKAGIIKAGRPVFTVPQPENSIQVIKERAREKEAHLQVVPSLMSYGFHGDDVSLGLAGMHQYLNATLALQLAKTWVMEERPGKLDFDDDDEPSCKHPKIADTLPFTDEVLSRGDVPEAEPFNVPEQFMRGLTSCYWPGRNQIIRREKITYYLDGAHTPRSITACCKWFERKAEAEARDLEGPVAKILIFNSTGDRDEYSLLPKLVASGFHGVVFCPNIISLYSHEATADTTNYTTTTERQMKRCEKNLIAFQNLLKQIQRDVSSSPLPTAAHVEPTHIEVAKASGSHHHQSVQHTPTGVVDQSFTTLDQSGDRTLTDNLDGSSSNRFVDAKLVKLPSMTDALQWAACCKDSNLSSPSIHDPTPSNHAISANHIQVLITGSLHLVGGVISILDPKLACRADVE